MSEVVVTTLYALPLPGSMVTPTKRISSTYHDLGVNGYLAEITSSAENSLVHSLLGSNVAYIGANKTTGSWRWKTSNSAMSYKPSFADNGNYLTMQADGACPSRWSAR